MKQALDILLAGVVDYAGLFPPAALDMAAATVAYARYLQDPDRRMLGRFVVPVVRLREFDDAAAALLPRGEDSQPWHLSALPGPDLTADIDLALKFNCRHWSQSEIGHAVIDTLEFRASVPAEIHAAASIMPRQFTPYIEIPIDSDPLEMVSALARSSARAKARTGGITPDSIPSASSVARFMIRCRDARVPFKLTAGLHHPLRAEYRLTYAPDSPRATMFGYLNMFVAAALAWRGCDESVLTAALNCTDAAAFSVTDTSIDFAGNVVSLDAIRDVRDHFIISFGSCSFREPVDELAALSIT